MIDLIEQLVKHATSTSSILSKLGKKLSTNSSVMTDKALPARTHHQRAALKLFLVSHAAAIIVAAPLHATAGMAGLGALPGGTSSYAYGVSADGNVVVGLSSTPKDNQAYRWTASGGMVGLGHLPGDIASHAAAVSADGSVVVGYSLRPSNIGTSQAFRWTESTGMVGLGFLPGDTSSAAVSVSADGKVIVGYSGIPDRRKRIFRWTKSGGMVPLGLLPGGTMSNIKSLSADGSVLVGYGDSKTGYQAFLWTKSRGIVGLGAAPGYAHSYAEGLSADGSVVVGTSGTPKETQGATSKGKTQAFRWTKSGGWIHLGFLPGGKFSYATAVSADGSVVVGYADINSVIQAFRWTQSGGMVSLGYFPGGKHSRAYAVSADGNVVVGDSLYIDNKSRRNESFRWTPDAAAK